MKLSTKIMISVFLVIIVLVTFDSFLTVKREVRVFENKMRRDAQLLGRVMKELVTYIWRTEGQDRTLELVKQIDKEEYHMKIRWVWLDAQPGSSYSPRISPAKLEPVVRGQEVSFKEESEENDGYLFTYFPVAVNSERKGALEISEPLSVLRNYTHRSIEQSFILAVLMLLTSGILLFLLGARFIERPLGQLVEKTKRIGNGDFSGDLELRGKDELSTLSGALNKMCKRLADAYESLRSETEARINALEQLRHKERLATLGHLVTGMAHELGTPLNVITGRASFIGTGDLEKKETVECSKIIREQAERMIKIIRQLLDFARRGTAEKSPANIQNLINQTMEILNPIAKKQNVKFRYVVNKNLPLVAIDQGQIQQVLINLISNGIDAMPHGGRLELELSIEPAFFLSEGKSKKKECVAIRIKDEGVGISQENQKAIFDPFFTTKEVGKGTGLGLSIAYGIVEEHGGWIDVESKVGEGSCFIVYLPIGENDE